MVRVGQFSHGGKDHFFAISPHGFVTGAFTDRPGLLKALGDVHHFEQWFGSKKRQAEILAAVERQDAEAFNRITNPEIPEGYLAFIHEKDRKPIVVMDSELKPVAHAFDGPCQGAVVDAVIAHLKARKPKKSGTSSVAAAPIRR